MSTTRVCDGCGEGMEKPAGGHIAITEDVSHPLSNYDLCSNCLLKFIEAIPTLIRNLGRARSEKM